MIHSVGGGAVEVDADPDGPVVGDDDGGVLEAPHAARPIAARAAANKRRIEGSERAGRGAMTAKVVRDLNNVRLSTRGVPGR
jgi:hypothetical protein